MIYLLYELFGASLARAGHRYVRVLEYRTFRTIFAALTSFVLVAYLGPWTIRLLKGRRASDRAHTTDTPALITSREKKKGTPTMGGLLVVGAILTAVGLWADLSNYYVFVGLFVLLWLGALGFVDDVTKLRHAKRDGLRVRTKLLFQAGLGVLVGAFLWAYQSRIDFAGDGHKLTLLFSKHLVVMAWFTFIPLAMVAIVGSTNAVNLTDGLDGLATGTVLVSALAFTALAYVAGNHTFAKYLYVPFVRGADELAVVGGALVGATMGFLWWNCHPAEVFMGDTGSLALGGVIGYLAVAIRQELLLVVVGGVFVIEAMSVLLQVGYFKWSRRRTGVGKRLFLCAPYHHHLEQKGWHENQITVRFWILSCLFASLAIATLKLR